MFDIRGWDAQNLENVHLNTELKHKPIVCVCGKVPKYFFIFQPYSFVTHFCSKTIKTNDSKDRISNRNDKNIPRIRHKLNKEESCPKTFYGGSVLLNCCRITKRYMFVISKQICHTDVDKNIDTLLLGSLEEFRKEKYTCNSMRPFCK